jgi:hypothetical protein
MKNTFLKFSKIWIAAILIVFIASGNVVAQKSVYDVIPGSGPKKENRDKDVVVVANGNDKVYKKYPSRRHKHLPPGQAKKIYGGSATDYAPGQMKKDDRDWNDHKKNRKQIKIKHSHKH